MQTVSVQVDQACISTFSEPHQQPTIRHYVKNGFRNKDRKLTAHDPEKLLAQKIFIQNLY
jgi:hypothetical protein